VTEANDPNNYGRQFRHFNCRLERMEDTLITPQEFDRAFNRVYEEIDALDHKIDRLEARIDQRFDELERKFDVVMQYITGQN
jgi:uncharacterized protein YdcH (DUF465 family)